MMTCIRQAIERALYGKTAEERADIQRRWVEMVVDNHVEEIFVRALADDGESDDESDGERDAGQ